MADCCWLTADGQILLPFMFIIALIYLTKICTFYSQLVDYQK